MDALTHYFRVQTRRSTSSYRDTFCNLGEGLGVQGNPPGAHLGAHPGALPGTPPGVGLGGPGLWGAWAGGSEALGFDLHPFRGNL